MKEVIYVSFLLYCQEKKVKPISEFDFYKTFHFEFPEREMNELCLKNFRLNQSSQEKLFRALFKFSNRAPQSKEDMFCIIRELKKKLKLELNVK